MAVRGTTTVEPDSVIVQRADRPWCGELELGSYQPVAELAGFD